MVDLGVRLEDRAGAASIWKPDDPAVLRAERDARAATAAAAAARKLRSALEAKRKVGTCGGRAGGARTATWVGSLGRRAA
jgi:hypothetical protein